MCLLYMANPPLNPDFLAAAEDLAEHPSFAKIRFAHMHLTPNFELLLDPPLPAWGTLVWLELVCVS